MIENDAQLAATLDYIAKWADTLEGMRLHELNKNGGIFPTIVAGPLHEIRTNLEAARAFANAGKDTPSPIANGSHKVTYRGIRTTDEGGRSAEQTVAAGS